MSINTMNLEEVFESVTPQYRLSLYFKLRGHIAYRAAKLAGMYVAKKAKLFWDNKTELGLEHLDTFNAAVEFARGEEISKYITESMGYEVNDMYSTIQGLVEYANKLNFDMQELVDPSGENRLVSGYKVRGVYFTDVEQRESWMNSISLLAEADTDKLGAPTYAEYAASVQDVRFRLTEAEWQTAQAEDDNLWKTYPAEVLDVLLGVGNEERDFLDLDPRSQIAAIENMRGKIGACIESVLKGLKYARIDRTQKIAEASTLKGLINGFNKTFCEMLDLPRYAAYAQFMYNYIPNTGEVKANPISRRIVSKQHEAEHRASAARVDDKTAESINESIEEMENDI